jgi:hypothetical protein
VTEKAYGISTLIGQLTWPPTWKGATKDQRRFAEEAAKVIRQFSLVLDEIARRETRVARNDAQLPPGYTFKTPIGQRAYEALMAVDQMEFPIKKAPVKEP